MPRERQTTKAFLREHLADKPAEAVARVTYGKFGFTADEHSLFRGLAKAAIDKFVVLNNLEFDSFFDRFVVAAVLVAVLAVDLVDGKVATMEGKNTNFGDWFDSVAIDGVGQIFTACVRGARAYKRGQRFTEIASYLSAATANSPRYFRARSTRKGVGVMEDGSNHKKPLWENAMNFFGAHGGRSSLEVGSAVLPEIQGVLDSFGTSMNVKVAYERFLESQGEPNGLVTEEKLRQAAAREKWLLGLNVLGVTAAITTAALVRYNDPKRKYSLDRSSKHVVQ